MNRQQAILNAQVFRRGQTTYFPQDGHYIEEQHKSINLAKRFCRGFKCVALRKGETMPVLEPTKEAA